MPVKHRKTSTVPNALNDTRRIGGDDWNNEHDVDLGVSDITGLEERLIPTDQVVQYRDDALAYRNQASGFADDAAESASEAASVVNSLAADDGATKVGTPDGTVQEALDGRPTASALAADNGATLVKTKLADSTAVLADSALLLGQRPSINNYGAPLDGTTNASPAIQKMVDACDVRLARFVYIPNWNTNFRIGTTVSAINPGMRIFGDQGATYNRGTTKLGWLEGAAGLTRMFDLGSSRTTGNAADQWQVDGISLKQAAGVTVRTIDGISFTSRTNGPDRGAIIRDVSAIGLRDAITIENPDVSVSLASLSIEGGVYQGNRSVLNAKGMLLGLRMVGVQAEQNIPVGDAAVIQGSINGPVTITDNMLEGQPNVVSIDIPPVTGNRPSILFARNYLEANSGSYVFRFRTSSPGCSLEVGPNYVQVLTASDYVLFEGNSGSAGLLFVNNDPFPFTLKNSNLRMLYGSRPFNYKTRGYEVRQMTSAAHTPEILLEDFANLADDSAAWTHALPAAGVTAMTPYGVRNVAATGTDLTATLAVAAGDLVCVNILMQVRESVAGSFVIRVRNQGNLFMRGGGGATGLPTDMRGRWALLSLPFISQVAATSVKVGFVANTGTYPSAIAGVTVRNYGAFANDGASKVLIEPTVPNIT